MANDSQRTALYRWEWKIRDMFPDAMKPMTLKECDELVKLVWEDYRGSSTPPAVTDGRGRRIAWGSRWEIKLPVWARNKIVVLHEIAHPLTGGDHVAHGPHFAQLLVELWGHYADIPVSLIKRMGREQKPRQVRFAEACDVPKPKSLAWQQWRLRKLELEAELEEHKRLEPR